MPLLCQSKKQLIIRLLSTTLVLPNPGISEIIIPISIEAFEHSKVEQSKKDDSKANKRLFKKNIAAQNLNKYFGIGRHIQTSIRHIIEMPEKEPKKIMEYLRGVI